MTWCMQTYVFPHLVVIVDWGIKGVGLVKQFGAMKDVRIVYMSELLMYFGLVLEFQGF